jgi:hypothetical protein
MLLHRLTTRIAKDAQLESMLVLTPKASLDDRNIPSTVVKLVQLNTKYVLSRTCAMKEPARSGGAGVTFGFVMIFLAIFVLKCE